MVQRTLTSMAAAATVLLAVGCQAPPPGGSAEAPPARATPDVDPALQQAAEAGRSLAQQLAAQRSSVATPPPDIIWLSPDIARDQRAVAAPPPPTQALRRIEPTPTPPPAPVATASAPVVEPTPAPAPVVAGPSRQELLDLLLTDLRQSDDPAMQRAIQAATLSVLDPRYSLDPEILAPLPPGRQAAVRQYHELLRSLHAGLVEGGRGLNRQQLADELYDVLGPMPIDITTLELCSRVEDFGVYTPFPEKRFLVGRPQWVIVYAELEHYTSKPADNGGYEVALTQELELYDDGGALVWKQDRVQIVDRSANRRRDFFTVQMIELPARLTVGRFALKLRVIDDATGNRAERSIDLELVADQSLVGR